MLPVTSKANSGLIIAFPDVCKTPVPLGGVPVPYPNIATTAAATQQKTKVGTKMVTGGATYSKTQGDEAATKTGIISSKNTEIAQLKGMLGQLNARLQAMTSRDPNEWQAVVQEYVVAASALYMANASD